MTNLSRRRFFGLLGGAAAVHFLPPIGGWKSDVIHSPLTNIGSIPGEYFWRMESNAGFLYWTLKGRPILLGTEPLLFTHREMFKLEGFNVPDIQA